jgi:hypothetical protein
MTSYITCINSCMHVRDSYFRTKKTLWWLACWIDRRDAHQENPFIYAASAWGYTGRSSYVSCVWRYPSEVAATLFSIHELEEALSLTEEGPDSTVDIATGYGLDGRGVRVRVPAGTRFFSSPHRPDRLWGPLSLLSNGCRGDLSPGVKRPGRQADHWPSTSAEVKNTWVYTSTPPCTFMA